MYEAVVHLLHAEDLDVVRETRSPLIKYVNKTFVEIMEKKAKVKNISVK